VIGNTATAVYVDTAECDRGEGPDLLRAEGFAVHSAVAATPADVLAAADGADALLVGASRIPAAVIEGLASRLRIISAIGVGVDHIDLEAARSAGIWVANVPDATTEEVAVTALSLALSLVRHVPFLDRDVRAGGWDAFATGRRQRPSRLTLGIVGLGRIGRHLGGLATPIFGRVCAHDPATVEPWPGGVDRLGLDDVLTGSDVVSLHLPAVPGAPPLIDATSLARMRHGAFLVNVSRGALVDTDALLAALDAGRLGGAALDVVAGEPPPADAPVRRHPRVVLTPHAAFWSDESEAASYARQAANVVAWKREGRPLTPVVEGAAP
jgi:phosphoglycerate dehydrogenase-like enzyme